VHNSECHNEILCCPALYCPGFEPFLCPGYPCCIYHPPVSSHLDYQIDCGTAVLMFRKSLFYLMASKHKGCATGNLDMPKRSHKVLPLRKKVNLGGIPRWWLEGGSRKCASYSEILEKLWRHTLQARPPRRGKTLTPPCLQLAQSISTSR
jgi:hypothetical protein